MLAVVACEPPTAPVFDNPYDPEYYTTPIPTSPGQLSLAGSSFDQVVLSWEDRSSFEDGYRIERSSAVDTTFVEVGVVGPDATTFVDSSLNLNHTYRYRVQASYAHLLSAYSDTLYVRYEGWREVDLASGVSTISVDVVFNASFSRPLLNISIGQLWDVEALRLVRPGGDVPAEASGFVFSRDGRLLAAGGQGAVHLWRSEDGRLVRRLDYASDKVQVSHLAFSPDGTTLAYVWADSEIRLWQWSNDRVVALPQSSSLADLQALAYTHDGSFLVGFDGSKLQYWDVSRTAFSHSVELSPGAGRSMYPGTFSPDGTLLAVCGPGSSVSVWRTQDGSLLHGTELEGQTTRPCAFMPDGRLLQAVREDFVSYIDVADGRLWARFDLGVPHGWLRGVALSADRRYLATLNRAASGALGLRVWDLEQEWTAVPLGEASEEHFNRLAAAGTGPPS